MKRTMTLALATVLLIACSPQATDTEATQPVTEAVVETTEAATEKIPGEYLHALDTAEGYIEKLHFGKAHLFLQLTSDSHNFSEEAALYAIEHADVDWMENAVLLAKDLRRILSIHGDDLYEELTKYWHLTEEEATYALEQIGEY